MGNHRLSALIKVVVLRGSTDCRQKRGAIVKRVIKLEKRRMLSFDYHLYTHCTVLELWKSFGLGKRGEMANYYGIDFRVGSSCSGAYKAVGEASTVTSDASFLVSSSLPMEKTKKKAFHSREDGAILIASLYTKKNSIVR
ncbi:hypothetical protein OUZ56_013875 [Daphnia magna]|uniref:Uncharacterized protein n=1 Tax=Daphnia magna TaxID=35525 RepID=A0ABQ9Z768_9CRUS|nr:hypothetical protein OUZ56_013875 [Daphnia magna]